MIGTKDPREYVGPASPDGVSMRRLTLGKAIGTSSVPAFIS